MQEKLKQIIEEKMPFLSKEVQEAINSLDWMTVSEEIGKKYLFESEIVDFQVETFLVLTGLEDPELYTINIENNVGTSREEANRITDEAEEKIFKPIYNTLMENIKKGGKAKNANGEQNLNFILSGGNYSAFVEIPPRLVEEGAGGGDLK